MRHRAERVLTDAAGAAADDGGVVLAAAEGADAAIAGERPEALPVLDAAQVFREGFGGGERGRARRRWPASPLASARARKVPMMSALELLMPGRAGEVAGQGEVRAPARLRESCCASRRATVIGKPAQRPVSGTSAGSSGNSARAPLDGIQEGDEGIGPRDHADDESALQRREEAPAAGVVGVLAQQLHAAGDMPERDGAGVAPRARRTPFRASVVSAQSRTSMPARCSATVGDVSPMSRGRGPRPRPAPRGSGSRARGWHSAPRPGARARPATEGVDVAARLEDVRLEGPGVHADAGARTEPGHGGRVGLLDDVGEVAVRRFPR